MKKSKLFGKKLMSAVLTGTLILGLCACDDYDDEYPDDDLEETEETASIALKNGDATPMQMSVNKETGAMSITRPSYSGEAMGEAGTWTIFVYLCGSDLESDGGAGVNDMAEMCEAAENGKVRFVVQTGGAKSWSYSGISSKKVQRFLVEDGDITKVYESSDSNMGDPGTLTDYLTWGINNYPADNMGLILWNHGGGSITGVCFDEKHDYDSLSLREVDSALLTASQYMTEKWEFIGFDACLMGNVEAANILANYAKFMYGSEEVEPGAGWNYKEIGDYLAGNPSASGAELGKVVCDSFYQGCIEADDYDCCTLAVIDLSKIDNVMTSFNDFAKDIYEQGSDADSLSTMIRKIENSESFGSNNDSEGYTNMVDIIGLVNACSAYSSNCDAVKSAVNDAVVYKIHGADHPNACGISIYFPIRLGGSQELKIFSDICISPFYMSFIDRRDFSGAIYYSEDGSSAADQDSQYYEDSENGIYYFVEGDTYYCYDQSSGTYYYYDEDAEEWYETHGGDLDASQYDYCSSDDWCSDYSDDYIYDDDGFWNWTVITITTHLRGLTAAIPRRQITTITQILTKKQVRVSTSSSCTPLLWTTKAYSDLL